MAIGIFNLSIIVFLRFAYLFRISGIPCTLHVDSVCHCVSVFPHVQFALPGLLSMMPFLTSACLVMSQWYVCLDLSYGVPPFIFLPPLHCPTIPQCVSSAAFESFPRRVSLQYFSWCAIWASFFIVFLIGFTTSSPLYISLNRDRPGMYGVSFHLAQLSRTPSAISSDITATLSRAL